MKQLEPFFWGIIAALGAMVGQIFFFVLFSTFLDPTGKMSYGDFFSMPVFILITAFIEEFFKYLLLSRRILEFSREKAFLLNTVLLGLGFFAVELMLILINSPVLKLPTILGIATLHLSTTIFMGYFVATRSSKGFNFAPSALLLATILHASYNLAITFANSLFSYFIIALLIVLLLTDLRLFLYFNQELAQD